MKKLIRAVRSRKAVLLSGAAVVAVACAVVGLALASNMGFKLNYGIVNAVNKLLYGSGVSIELTDGDGSPALVVELDPVNEGWVLQNSNMGFKLNIKSVPPWPGMEVVVGATECTLYQDGSNKIILVHPYWGSIAL